MGPLAPRAFANDADQNVRAPDEDDEDKETVKELEKFANEFLTVDEDKKIHVRKEFKDNLEESPLPPDQLERQVQMYLKVGDDGKLHIRDVEMIRPFLPQVKAYLPQLRALMKKSPEERKDELDKMMKDRGLPGGEPKKDGARDGKPGEKSAEKPGERTRPGTPLPEPKFERRPEGGIAPERLANRIQQLEERIARLEGSLDRIEKLLGGKPRTEERAAGPAKPRYREEPWGWRAEPGENPRSDRRGDRPSTRERRGRDEDEGDRGQGEDLRKMGDRIQKELKKRLGDDFNPDELKKVMERIQREMRDRFGGDRGRRDDERGDRKRGDRDGRRGDRRDRDERDDDDDDD
ncbi:hypothetical protein HY251_15335 [bacterium]|nr:hypothetical protein [bacterium]